MNKQKIVSMICSAIVVVGVAGWSRPAVAAPELRFLLSQRVIVKKTDGTVIRGFLLRVSPQQIIVGQGSRKIIRVKRSDVASVRAAGVQSRRRSRLGTAGGAPESSSGTAQVNGLTRLTVERRVSRAKVVLTLGVVFLTVGIVGTIGGVSALRKAKRDAAAAEEESSGSNCLWGEGGPHCSPMGDGMAGAGAALLTGLAAIVGASGFIMALYGAGQWSHNAGLLKRFRIDIDPARGRYGFSMSYRF